jgi:hypothetical protein
MPSATPSTATALATANGDPPNCAQSGSAQDALAIAALVTSGGSVASGAPSGYSSLITRSNAFGAALSTAVKSLTAASSENPGAFTSASTNTVAATLIVASTAIASNARASQLVAEIVTSNDDNGIPVAPPTSTVDEEACVNLML